MEVEILYRPAYSMAVVTLSPGEEINVEAGSMVSMTEGMEVQTRLEGGILRSLSRTLLGGESFFFNVFRAPAAGGQVNLASTLPGDMMVIQMQEESLMVQGGSFIAASNGIAVDAKWGGARTFFAKEGLFMLRAQGTGLLVLASYGAIHAIELLPDQRYTVDTGHLVSFSEGMGFNVRPIGGVRSSLLSGEGLVVDLIGPGRVYMQTRSEDALLSWLLPQLSQDRDR